MKWRCVICRDTWPKYYRLLYVWKEDLNWCYFIFYRLIILLRTFRRGNTEVSRSCWVRAMARQLISGPPHVWPLSWPLVTTFLNLIVARITRETRIIWHTSSNSSNLFQGILLSRGNTRANSLTNEVTFFKITELNVFWREKSTSGVRANRLPAH